MEDRLGLICSTLIILAVIAAFAYGCNLDYQYRHDLMTQEQH